MAGSRLLTGGTFNAVYLVNAVLADAETFAVALPRSIADVLDWSTSTCGTATSWSSRPGPGAGSAP